MLGGAPRARPSRFPIGGTPFRGSPTPSARTREFRRHVCAHAPRGPIANFGVPPIGEFPSLLEPAPPSGGARRQRRRSFARRPSIGDSHSNYWRFGDPRAAYCNFSAPTIGDPSARGRRTTHATYWRHATARRSRPIGLRGAPTLCSRRWLAESRPYVARRERQSPGKALPKLLESRRSRTRQPIGEVRPPDSLSL